MIPVHFLRSGRVLDGRVVIEGDVHALPGGTAMQAVNSGEARFVVKVRALKPHVSIGDLVCAVGQEAYTDRSRALDLHATGHVAIVSGLANPESNDLALARALAAGDDAMVARLAWFPPPPTPPAPPRRLPLPNRADADMATR